MTTRSRLMKALVAALMLVGIFTTTNGAAANAADGPQMWFVAAGGTGDCQLFTPCGSVMKAINKSSAGDRIMLSSGSYGDLYVKNTSRTENFNQNIVIEPINGATVRSIPFAAMSRTSLTGTSPCPVLCTCTARPTTTW